MSEEPVRERESLRRGEKNRPSKRAETPRHLHRKLEIYQKALDLFSRNGYDATSMSMVADVLGMSKANLYYYCSSKENLLYQIHLDDLQRNFIPILDEAERLPDPKDRLAFFLRNVALMCTSSRAPRLMVQEFRSLSRRHRREIRAVWRRAYGLLRSAVRELQQEGRGRKFRESFLTFLGSGMAFWPLYWWDYGRQTNAEEFAEAVVDIFYNGFLVEEKSK